MFGTKPWATIREALTPLGDGARAEVQELAIRYLGRTAGTAYAEEFSTPDEVIVRITPENWRTEVLG